MARRLCARCGLCGGRALAQRRVVRERSGHEQDGSEGVHVTSGVWTERARRLTRMEWTAPMIGSCCRRLFNDRRLSSG